MKNLLVLVALTIGLVSVANAKWERPSSSMSWSTLDARQDVHFSYPQFALSHGFFVRAPGVCVDGDVLRTKNKVTKCYNMNNDNVCTQEIRVYAAKAMNGTRAVCTRYEGESDGGGCINWEQVPYSIDRNYNIKVSRRITEEGDSKPGRHLFNKSLRISTCK